MSGNGVKNEYSIVLNADNENVQIKKEKFDDDIFLQPNECETWNIDHQATVKLESGEAGFIHVTDSTLLEGNRSIKCEFFSVQVKTETADSDVNAGYSTDEHFQPYNKAVKPEPEANLIHPKESENTSADLYNYQSVESAISDVQISCSNCRKIIEKGVKIYTLLDNDQQRQYACNECFIKRGANEVTEVRFSNSAQAVLPRNVKRFKCQICYNLYSRKETLDNHIDSVHYNLKKFKCTLCPNAFAKAVSLKTHFDSIHRGIAQPKFHCYECNAEFSSKQSMRAHVDVIHRNIKNFFCDKCNRGFYEKSKYVFHLNSVHKDVKKFKCEQCGYAAALQFILKNHVDIVHKKIKKFTCNLCNREFARSANLKGHIDAVHLKLRKFHCEQCSFSALSRAALRKHDNARHKNITYDCDSCGKSFSFKQMMMRHIIAVHLKLKDYLCDDCGRAFASKGDLSTHINVVHKLMRKYAHVCNECGRAFMKRNRLKKHIAQDHKIKIEDDAEGKMLLLNVLYA